MELAVRRVVLRIYIMQLFLKVAARNFLFLVVDVDSGDPWRQKQREHHHLVSKDLALAEACTYFESEAKKYAT